MDTTKSAEEGSPEHRSHSPGPSAPTSWILWAGTVNLFGGFDERLRAAAESNCEWVSLSMMDVVAARDAGIEVDALGARARESGLRLIMDPLMGWHPSYATSASPFARYSPHQVLTAAAGLGAELVSAVAADDSPLDVDLMAEHFARTCDMAADFGAQVQLEFIPWTAVPDLATAWDIVCRADRPNGGLLVDAWHFYRGTPDLALLSSIPGERVFSVQLDDGVLLPGPGTREQTFERDLPGEGEFDLNALISTLDAIGGLTRVGPEVINSRMRQLDASTAARRAMSCSRALIAEATAGAHRRA